MNDRQLEIKNWFNYVYRTRGYKYLRPIEAYEIFVALLSPEKNKLHLDIACGLGLLLRKMADAGAEVYGVDISEEAVSASKKLCPEATVLLENAEYLPFPDATFDYITCIGSLERMINREKALKEQQRVAKPGACFCYMVRNSENFTWKYFLKPLGLKNKKGHQDALNYEQWRQLFLACGFTILAAYPDHWPYLRLRKIFYPGSTDFGKIRKFPFGLKLAYEFIFVLAKS